CAFSEIIKTCIGFKITYDELDLLRNRIIQWVRDYEEYYYQYDEGRLSACPLTIHGFIHQLRARYDVEDELPTRKRDKSVLSRSEKVYDGYPDMILRAPYKRMNSPDTITRKRIAGYFAAVLSKARKNIEPQLPEIMPRWGKVRIADGDSIRSVSASADESDGESQRDKMFIRVGLSFYELQVQNDDDDWIPKIFYGRLEEILVCQLPKDKLWGSMSGGTRLLAVITPCSTSGKDAATEYTSYTQTTQTIVTDLQTVVAVVGRFRTRGEWAIIDRTGGHLHPQFVIREDEY
ncbi:hypothetical protein C8R47DRAFT_995638, partial [Mycena vitilis]